MKPKWIDEIKIENIFFRLIYFKYIFHTTHNKKYD